MSRPDRQEPNDGAASNAALPAKYEVGYGKPPAEHRFKKGASGNPRGRPKGAKNNPVPMRGVSPADRLILQEAYRPVTVREGDTTIEMPAIQAAMRALGISAMKGSRLAQRALAELVRDAEAKHHAETEAAMEAMITFKQKWTEEIERCRRSGLPEPDIIPHPDDVMIDFRNGGVKVRGPLNADEKPEWDRWIQRRDDAQAEVTEYAKLHRKARKPEQKAMWLEWWLAEQALFDLLNERLGGRYKTELQNRSYASGASRPGRPLEEYGAMIRQKRPSKFMSGRK
jgi:hypothetical protein